MNNAQLYLAWLRTVAPAVYISAVRRATNQPRSLGGLTDDLVQQSLAPGVSHSFLGDDTSSMLDPITVTAQYLPPPITTDYSFSAPTTDFSNIAAPAPVAIDSGFSPLPSSPTGGGTSTFANILTAVTAIGAGVLNASNQSKLISLNTTRAQQGLAPVDAYGRLVTPSRTSAAGSSLLAFERSIAGSSGSMLPIILGVLGIGAFFVMSRKSA
jgi:hypothetical protein